MPKDFLKGAADSYDVVVIGSGLGGLTAANILAREGRSVLLLEQHYKLGGMATWFKRPGGHIFDISLHGFPYGMVKSCRRYWSREIADSIVQLEHVRFDNPMFSLTTTFDRADFTQLLTTRFGIEPAAVEQFFDSARNMNFYDDQTLTTQQLFERFFPGREDVIRLLMEPITYANGSTLEDPALTYGIVFSNFMSKGVFTFQGGTDHLIQSMERTMIESGVDIRIRCDVESVNIRNGRIESVTVNGHAIKTTCVVSNANLRSTIFNLVGQQYFDPGFVEQAREVRLNNSSTQVYMALREGDAIERDTGDLLFCSTAAAFRTELLLSRDISSRTFSFYYPDIRPQGKGRYLIVSSTNASFDDWSGLSDEEYEASKQDLVTTTLDALGKYVPNCRERIVHAEAATPRTFRHYTKHIDGSSFGTKFEGLAVSRALSDQIPGLYHAGSCGIIMSGWLGTINYGVIVANDVFNFLTDMPATSPVNTASRIFQQPMSSNTMKSVHDLLAHRPPMLLIDEIASQSDCEIVCLKTFHPDEFFFQGHYPDYPLVPGVILCECGAQAGAVLLSRLDIDEGSIPVLSKLDNVRFKSMVRPGDSIEIRVTLDEQLSNAFYMSAKITCAGQTAARFNFVCTAAKKLEAEV